MHRNPYITVNLQAVAKIVLAQQNNLLARFASFDGSKTHVPRLTLARHRQKVDNAPEIKAAHGSPRSLTPPSFFTCYEKCALVSLDRNRTKDLQRSPAPRRAAPWSRFDLNLAFT